MSKASLLLFIPLVFLLGCGKSTGDSSVSPREGGFVVVMEGGHGLVVSTMDIGYKSWEEANRACDELILEGHDDWRLPTREELDLIYSELFIKGQVVLKDDTYWSSSKQDDHHYWAKDFGNGRWKNDAMTLEQNLYRAVRSF